MVSEAPKFIILEGRDGTNYSYRDTLVAFHRLSANPEVRKFETIINRPIYNTAEEKDGHSYAGNISHKDAILISLHLGHRLLTTHQLLDLLIDLRSGKILFDENGEIIEECYREIMVDEMIGRRDPSRAEWVEDAFDLENEEVYRKTDFYLSNGLVTPRSKENLTEDFVLDTSRKSKLAGFRYYIRPENEHSATWFDAMSNWSVLSHSGCPETRELELGMRLSRPK